MDKKGVLLNEELTVERLMSAFFYEFPENFDYAGEAHPGWEFVYVEQGQVKVQAGEDAYILKSGEMVCHQPMEYHCIRPYHGVASVIIFCFTCQGQRMDWFRNKILTITPRQVQYLSDIAANAQRLLISKAPLEISRDGSMERSASGTVAQEQILKNTIELLMLSLLESESRERSERVEKYAQHIYRSHLTREIKAYLQDNLEKPICLEDLSDRFSYSLSSIRRIFRDETGVSVMEYLARLRTQKARELLQHSNMTVEEIAHCTGYNSISYFSKSFKARTGKSPTTYRQK